LRFSASSALPRATPTGLRGHCDEPRALRNLNTSATSWLAPSPHRALRLQWLRLQQLRRLLLRRWWTFAGAW
jgi:hypothetical protein